MSMPAALWKPLDGQVQCRLCAHFCVIPPGGQGQCGVRENQHGQLVTRSFDKVAAVQLDPIEKKPLFHFLPGTTTLSIGTPGCNLGCLFCQNASLSQPPRQHLPLHGDTLPPADIVALALEHRAASVAYTYSEPTIFFELMAATADLALEAGLANVMVSNGFQSPDCLKALGRRIQAANIDLKAFTEQFYRDICDARLAPVLKNFVHMKDLGWHLEVTTLVIPDLNDSDRELTDIARFIRHDLGADTPWHVSRFHPCHRMQDRPVTPLQTLSRAYAIGRAEGLHHVFVGNVPGSGMENTSCPGCGRTVVERAGFRILHNDLQDGGCHHCGHRILASPRLEP